MAEFYGYNPPFIGGLQNVMSRQEDVRLIQNDILQLLMTVPGERIYRPNFGVSLRNFVFEQMVDDDIERLQDEIEQTVGVFEPRVIVDYVIIERVPNENSIKIKVVAKLKHDPTKEVNVETFMMTG